MNKDYYECDFCKKLVEDVLLLIPPDKHERYNVCIVCAQLKDFDEETTFNQ